jgi:phenazine biosynthesis protein phzE
VTGRQVTARAALDDVLARQAWALVRRGTEDTVSLVGGPVETVARIADVPLADGVPPAGRRFDRLLAIPFRQVAERGFEAHDDGAPLTVVQIEAEHDVPVGELLTALPREVIGFADRGGFDLDDAAYAGLVEALIHDEIGQGQAANLVVGRHYRARLRDWDAAKALTVYRRLLEDEQGAYWTYLFYTGERYLIGASPERHVSVQGGADTAAVRMNPISGTFRLAGVPQDPTSGSGSTSGSPLKEALLSFLADDKEIYELFMVVDEELKMMCDICSEGGQVLGPFLKPMSHLVHTEYLLAGRTGRDVREVLRDTMFAATVTGSPVQNACRLIKKYERTGRGYYGAVLALLGRDGGGSPTVDAPIVIRTADVGTDGTLTVTAGATLVRDSRPDYEVSETHAKAAGVLSAFGLIPATNRPAAGLAELIADEDVTIALAARNQRLSRFWLTDQSDAAPIPELKGRTAVVLDGEDAFVNMLRHLLRVLGMSTTLVRHQDYAAGALDGHDVAVVGPGPGDPRDASDPKIATFRAAVDELLESGRPFLAVCLGHQVLCERLGIPLAYKDIVFQGIQSEVVLAGGAASERVGFYNTFVAHSSGRPAGGVCVDSDPVTGDVHLVRGPHYRGIQFHAESILTEHGYALLRDLMLELIGDR